MSSTDLITCSILITYQFDIVKDIVVKNTMTT